MNDCRFDAVVVAVPWRRVGELLTDPLRACVAGIETGYRNWSRPRLPPFICGSISRLPNLPHAVLPGRIKPMVVQSRCASDFDGDLDATTIDGHYYQVVISASRRLADRSARDIVSEVVQRELASIWPATARGKAAAIAVDYRGARRVLGAAGVERIRSDRSRKPPFQTYFWPAIGPPPVGPPRWKGQCAAAIWPQKRVLSHLQSTQRRCWRRICRRPLIDVPSLRGAVIYSNCSITPSKNFASRSEQTRAVSRNRHRSLTMEGRRTIGAGRRANAPHPRLFAGDQPLHVGGQLVVDGVANRANGQKPLLLTAADFRHAQGFHVDGNRFMLPPQFAFLFGLERHTINCQ